MLDGQRKRPVTRCHVLVPRGERKIAEFHVTTASTRTYWVFALEIIVKVYNHIVRHWRKDAPTEALISSLPKTDLCIWEGNVYRILVQGSRRRI